MNLYTSAISVPKWIERLMCWLRPSSNATSVQHLSTSLRSDVTILTEVQLYTMLEQFADWLMGETDFNAIERSHAKLGLTAEFSEASRVKMLDTIGGQLKSWLLSASSNSIVPVYVTWIDPVKHSEEEITEQLMKLRDSQLLFRERALDVARSNLIFIVVEKYIASLRGHPFVLPDDYDERGDEELVAYVKAQFYALLDHFDAAPGHYQTGLRAMCSYELMFFFYDRSPKDFHLQLKALTTPKIWKSEINRIDSDWVRRCRHHMTLS
ncbi:hypothetical protein AB6D11_00710 [Vibrio splendidus]